MGRSAFFGTSILPIAARWLPFKPKIWLDVSGKVVSYCSAAIPMRICADARWMSKTYSLDATSAIHAIADAAQRWSDADFPPRVRVTAAISRRTTYAIPIVDYALDRL